MGHKFDIKNMHKLDSEERRKILPPYVTLAKVGLKENDIIADVGCGVGYFTMPAAHIVGSNGKVYGLDVSIEMLEEVEKKISEQNITNVTTVLTDENNLKVADGEVTIAFISNVLHEVDDAGSFLNEVNRIVSDSGRIVVLEWQKVKSDFGPPVDHRLDSEYVQMLLQENGFESLKTLNIGEHFYAVLGQKR